jgi:LPPG:FO 2-phospho-L-lactate transferase
MIVSLAGGIGAARFLEGLIHVVPQSKITIIGNVGDDIEIHGLHISPDLDIVLYTLAGVVDRSKGWGFRQDTFQSQGVLQKYGHETWFNLGDKDLATHIYRTEQLRNGKLLSTVTQDLVHRFGLRIRLIPATDDPFQTHVDTDSGSMHFEEYMVKRHARPTVRRVIFRGAKSSRPARRVIESIREAAGIVISPSNPIVSIGPILAVPGIRSALRKAKAKVIGISPIIAGKTVKGPADRMMRALGWKPTALGVAEYYQDFLDTLIIDRADRKLCPEIRTLGIKPVVTNALMRKMADKIQLALTVKHEFDT